MCFSRRRQHSKRILSFSECFEFVDKIFSLSDLFSALHIIFVKQSISTFSLTILFLAQPRFTIKLPSSVQRLVKGTTLVLHCLADAWPEPNLVWKKNDRILMQSDDNRIQIFSNNTLK